MANLADLQAELLRKKSELKDKKIGEGTYIRAEKKEKAGPSMFSKKNKGVGDRIEKDLEEKEKEERSFENARKKLEMKAKMYDKLARGEKGILDNDRTGLEERVMVDFQQKALDHFKEEKQKAEKLREEEQNKKKIRDIGNGKVEYTDSLGRTRVVDKEEVKGLLDMDKDLRPDTAEEDNPHSTFHKMKFIKSTELEVEEDTPKAPEVEVKKKLLVSSDMQREELRQKWEDQERELLDKPEVHFQDVLFDEVRDLGTGYFAFSRDEADREKQKADLTEMREETLTARQKADKIKAKRAEMLKARLAKVKARRGIETTPEEKEKEEEEQRQKEKEEEEKKKAAERERLFEYQLDLARKAKTRAWDQGKEPTLDNDREGPSWEQRTEEMRNERNPDFAPPTTYSKQKHAGNKRKKPDIPKEEEEEEDPLLKQLRSLKNLVSF